MEITHQIIDITQYEANQHRPATIISRKPAERWLVRNLPVGVTGTDAQEWGHVQSKEHVRIPLFPYLANGNNPAVALAFACEIALRILSMVDNVTVLRTHFVIGEPMQQVSDIPDAPPVIRFWLGFGFVIQERHGH